MGRFIAALVMVGMIGTGAYYFFWLKTMSPHVVQVKELLEHIEGEWGDVGASFGHNGVSVGGYPFTPYVMIDNPHVKYAQGAEDFRIGFDEVTLYVANGGAYEMVPSEPIVTYFKSGGKVMKYDVTFSGEPDVMLSPKGRQRGGNRLAPLKQLKVRMSETLNLFVYHGSKDRRRITFNAPPVAVPIPYDIPDDPRRIIQIFMYMLDEAYVREPLKAPAR